MEAHENPFSLFLKSQAKMLLVRVGSTPLLYEDGQGRELSPTESDPGDVMSLIKSITPNAQQQLLKEVGFVEFEMRLPDYLLHVTAAWSDADKEVRLCKRN